RILEVDACEVQGARRRTQTRERHSPGPHPQPRTTSLPPQDGNVAQGGHATAAHGRSDAGANPRATQTRAATWKARPQTPRLFSPAGPGGVLRPARRPAEVSELRPSL